MENTQRHRKRGAFIGIAFMIGILPALDWLNAWRAEEYVKRFEEYAASGMCTATEPCRVDGLGADMCNTLIGGLLVELWWTKRLRARLPGKLEPERGFCRRSADDNTVFYVAPP